MPKNRPEPSERTMGRGFWLALIVALFSVLALWALNWFLLAENIPSSSARGQFGDQFGSVNALFSGFAFVALVITVIFQGRELRFQRDELRLQREEMAGSREQLAQQARVQRHAIHAQIAQMRIDALAASICAIEMDSLSKTPSSRAPFAADIRNVTHEMEGILERIEAEVGIDLGPRNEGSGAELGAHDQHAT